MADLTNQTSIPPSELPSTSDPTKSSSASFVIPGSGDAHKFVTTEIVEKFKAFLDAFDRANNAWYQHYKGYKCIDRPAFSTAGKEAVVAINSHKVLKLPTIPIYQYDVSHSPGYLLRLSLMHFRSLLGLEMRSVVWRTPSGTRRRCNPSFPLEFSSMGTSLLGKYHNLNLHDS